MTTRARSISVVIWRNVDDGINVSGTGRFISGIVERVDMEKGVRRRSRTETGLYYGTTLLGYSDEGTGQRRYMTDPELSKIISPSMAMMVEVTLRYLSLFAKGLRKGVA